MGEPKIKRIVDKARHEGATDDDIKEYWNLPDLSRRMVVWSENNFRYLAFTQAKDDGLSTDDAAAGVHKMFPIYGDPEDTSKLSGDNRPIPPELRGRVDLHRQARGAKYIADQVNNFSSYNSYVRHAIQNGLKCLYGLLSTIILALFKHGQTGGSQGHSSVPPEVYDSGIVPGISHSMPVAPSRPYWGFPPGKRRSPYEI